MLGRLPALGVSIQSPDDDEGLPQDEPVMVVLGRSTPTFAEGSGRGSFSKRPTTTTAYCSIADDAWAKACSLSDSHRKECAE